MRLTRFILLLLLVTFSLTDRIIGQNTKEGQPVVSREYGYNHLSGYLKSLLDQYLDTYFPAGRQLNQVLTDLASLRNTTRVAEALLFRDQPGDRENAVTILRWILKNQHTDESSDSYGLWKTNLKNDRLDQNWREFIGCDLILIYHHYKQILPSDLVADIRTGLIHAARGALRRNVTAEYSNISSMSAFLMNYVGNEYQIEALKIGGLKKAHEIYTLYNRYHTFSEYNSPTYYGVTLIGFALWRQLSSGEMKSMGRFLENSIWNEIASNYQPKLRNLTGPYFRSYGMDMQKYLSITGLWMAVALEDKNLAPIPNKDGAKEDELSNLAPIFHLGLSIPEQVLPLLKENSIVRYIDRLVPDHAYGDTLKRVTATIHSDWMMGGTWGSRRVFAQIKTGTIHWQNGSGESEWLLVPGEGTTNVRVTKTKMSIFKNAAASREVNIYLYARDVSVSNFSEKWWEFSSMKFKVKSALKMEFTKVTDPAILHHVCELSETYPAVMKITVNIPPDWDPEQPLVEITPTR